MVITVIVSVVNTEKRYNILENGLFIITLVMQTAVTILAYRHVELIFTLLWAYFTYTVIVRNREAQKE